MKGIKKRESAARANDRLFELGLQHVAFRCHFCDDREREAILIGHQRAEILREKFGKHIESSIHQIRRCGAISRLESTSDPFPTSRSSAELCFM